MATQKQKGLAKVEELPDVRWLAFQEHYLVSGNAYQSAIQAGFSEEYAKVITSRIPDKVIKSLNDALEHKGITPDKIADKINTLLDAQKKVRTYIKGDLTSEYEEEDHQAIDKGISHAVKIRGDYAPEKSVQVQIKADVKDFTKLDKIKDEYEAKFIEALNE